MDGNQHYNKQLEHLDKGIPFSMFGICNISHDLGIDQDDMSLGIDAYNLATFYKIDKIIKAMGQLCNAAPIKMQ